VDRTGGALGAADGGKGGGGGAAEEGNGGGGGAAAEGGGGGADGGAGADGVVGVDARFDGLRKAGGTGGFFPIGGFGLVGISGADDNETILEGRRLSLKFAIEREGGGGTPPGGLGGIPGGLGAVPVGGFGAEVREVSGSDKYGLELTAPVATPPLFLNFGIPPANNPPS